MFVRAVLPIRDGLIALGIEATMIYAGEGTVTPSKRPNFVRTGARTN